MSDLWEYKGTYYFNTTEHIAKIAGMVEEILKGKKYVFVSAYAYKDWEPEIKLDQRMQSISTWKNDGKDDRFGGFHVHDTYGVWGCSFINQERHEKTGHISLFRNGLQVKEVNVFGEWFWWKVIVQEDEE